MPRELVHWKVVEQAIAALPASEHSLRACLTEYGGTARLGAVGHDAPFYYRLGGHSFESAAQVLHGTLGEDTFTPLRSALLSAAALEERQRKAVVAFLLGMLSHAATDRQFHPMVYYFTGNYYAADATERTEARIRHRILEVYLDSWVYAHYGRPEEERITSLVHRAGNGLQTVYSFLDAVLSPAIIKQLPKDMQAEVEQQSVYHPGVWEASMIDMERCQAMFLSKAVARVAQGLRMILGARFDAIEALFRLGRTDVETAFDSPLQYRNPVTGDRQEDSIEQLLQQSVVETLRLWQLCGAILEGDCSPSEDLAAEQGRSLDFDLPLVQVGPPNYFSKRGLPLPGLEKTFAR